VRNPSTISQLREDNPAFTEGGIRWQIFNSERNGLAEAGAIIRIGRRIYIDADAYFAWLEAQQPWAERR